MPDDKGPMTLLDAITAKLQADQERGDEHRDQYEADQFVAISSFEKATRLKERDPVAYDAAYRYTPEDMALAIYRARRDAAIRLGKFDPAQYAEDEGTA